MKSLIIRLLLIFTPIVLITILTIDGLKNSKLEKIKEQKVSSLHKEYNSSLEQLKKTSDLIFFNNLLYDKKIVDIYKKLNSSNSNSLGFELFNHVKSRYHYFKSYGLKQIKFYDINKNLFIQMEDYKKNQKQSNQKLFIKDNKTKENFGLEVSNNSLSISFIKPFYDNQLVQIGYIKLEFEPAYLLNHIQKNIDFNTMLLFKSSKDSKNFKKFDLNNDYQFLDSRFNKIRYDKNQLKQIEDKAESIKYTMKKKGDLSFIYKKDRQYNILNLSLLPNKLKQNDNFYLFSYKTNDNEIKDVIYGYFYSISFLIGLYIIIFALFYYLNKYKKKLNNKIVEHNYLLDAIDDYVVLVETNKKGIITYVTEAFCDICGYSKEELVGKNINIIRHPDVSKKFFENLWKELYKNHMWEGEIKNMDKFGNSYWVKGTIFPKYDENRKIKGFMSIRVNTTDAKQLSKVNRLLKEDLSNKLTEIKIKDKDLIDNTKVALMSKVLDAVAHQWKKPISNISFELANLNARVKSLSNNHDLMQIHNSITKEMKLLSMTLNEFKSFFSKDSSMDRFNLYQATNEAIEMIKEEIRDSKLTISLNTKKDVNCYGVYSEFKHIMVSLIKNSIDEIDYSKVKNPVIDISYIQDNSDILLKYEDNIQVLENNILDDVFEKDFDTNKERGLNLYIAKLLIEKTGASVWHETVNKNATIYIKLISKDRRKGLR
ncbi:MAG: PAS domain S-box protein [Campylobacterota bacterium]